MPKKGAIEKSDEMPTSRRNFQMMIFDENGDTLETAGNLRARFEALQLLQTNKEPGKESDKFRVKRFKVCGKYDFVRFKSERALTV